MSGLVMILRSNSPAVPSAMVSLPLLWHDALPVKFSLPGVLRTCFSIGGTS